MRFSLFIVAAAVILTLLAASCGSGRQTASSTKKERTGQPRGSETAAPAQTEPSSTEAQDKRPVVVAFGDSLTAGVAGRSYPDDLQDLLDQHKLLFRVENQGVSGDTTSDGLARIGNVIAEHPTLVILEFGGNDGLRGIPVESTRKNLTEMIEQLKAARIPVFLLGITLPPNYGPDYVEPFTKMFPQLAHEYRLPYIPFLLAHVYKDRELMQPDGIHPSGAGNKVVAQDVFLLIKPALERQARKGGAA